MLSFHPPHISYYIIFKLAHQLVFSINLYFPGEQIIVLYNIIFFVILNHPSNPNP